MVSLHTLACVYTGKKMSLAYSEWGNSFFREEDLVRRRKVKAIATLTFLLENAELSSLMIFSQDQLALKVGLQQCANKEAKLSFNYWNSVDTPLLDIHFLGFGIALSQNVRPVLQKMWSVEQQYRQYQECVRNVNFPTSLWISWIRIAGGQGPRTCVLTSLPCGSAECGKHLLEAPGEEPVWSTSVC